MSLLLLLPSAIGIVTTSTAPATTYWTTINKPNTGWVTSNWDYKNVWGEWETYTWGQIQSSGLTWGNMAGYTFAVTASTPITTWTVVT